MEPQDLKSSLSQVWRVASPAVYTLVLAAFMRLATLGYFTPQQATDFTKIVMDGLVTGAPLVLAAYLAWKRTRLQMIQTTDALPGVLGVAVIPSIAADVPSLTVATPANLFSELKKNTDA